MPSKKKKNQEAEDVMNEIQFVKSSLHDLNRRIDLVNERLDRVTTIFDWHSHPRTEMTGRPMFMQNEFEQAMKQSQEQQLQQQQTQPVEVPEPKPEPEPEEE